MKFFGLLYLMISLPGMAAPCKVYGISDGPQKLDCTFEKNNQSHLTCANGLYLLDGVEVSEAFHLEVEQGSSPLVFKSTKKNLTVVKEKINYSAELEKNDETFSGTCL
jgi:hypothetical protein